MYTYDERHVVLMRDTYSGEWATPHDDAELMAIAREWCDTSEPGVAEAVEALPGGSGDRDVLDLGVTIEELDPADRDEVPTEVWCEWIAGGWLSAGRVWDDGRVIISDYRPPMYVVGEWEWQGGPVSVRSHHGDQERRWRRVASLSDLRRAVEEASAEEAEWEAEQQRQTEEARAAEAPLRDVAARITDAQRQLDALVAERAALVAERPDWTGRRLARALGISEMMVSKIRRK
jgi:hypothetical protein